MIYRLEYIVGLCFDSRGVVAAVAIGALLGHDGLRFCFHLLSSSLFLLPLIFFFFFFLDPFQPFTIWLALHIGNNGRLVVLALFLHFDHNRIFRNLVLSLDG